MVIFLNLQMHLMSESRRRIQKGATLCLARNAHLPGLDVSRPWAWKICGISIWNMWNKYEEYLGIYDIYIFLIDI